MAKIPIKIQYRSSKVFVSAVISDQLDDAARQEIIGFSKLSPTRQLREAILKLVGGSEEFHFNWETNLYKADYNSNSQVWIIECAHAPTIGLPKTQGAMIVYPSTSQANQQDVLTIAGIEVAQHNQRMSLGPLRWGGAYKGVGSKLIRRARDLSQTMGFQGRVGGHSTPGAEPFYLGLGFTKHKGLTDPHGNVYFELN